MVVKKRSSFLESSEKYALPLICKHKAAHQAMKTIVQTVPQDQRLGDDVGSSLWNRWNSGPLVRLTPSKKDDSVELPTWCNPQDDNTSLTTATKSKIIVTTRPKKQTALSGLIVLLMLVGVSAYWLLTGSLAQTLSETELVVAVRNQINIKLRSAEKDVRMLSRELAATEALFERQRRKREERERAELKQWNEKRYLGQAQLDELKDRVKVSSDLRVDLKEAIRRQSRQDVESRYGIGKTIQVEFTLQFPNGDDGPNTIKMEMAPLELMPHSVDTFLKMVSFGLWDGCSFVLSAMHVLKAAPIPYERTKNPTEASKRFIEKRLNGPVFKEYNEAFPHRPLTVGFTGGESPSFYINTEDNTELHAGDPAFAKVVDGFDTIERVKKGPKENGIWLRDRIGFKSARIIVI
jgi:cyclophilin family peptidyl-prolyl cis-trans isomerase